MDAYELIDRYVHEVGAHLPRKMSKDIQEELRSLLQDALEAEVGDSGMEPTVKATAEFLREFGHPEAVAAQYRPEQSLIGPQLFPTYQLVLTIALAVIGGLHLMGLLFLIWQGGAENIAQAVLNVAGSFMQTGLINAGIITLIFALLERVEEISWEDEKKEDKTWDPLALPAVDDTERVKWGELVSEIVFAALFIVLFNFFFESIGLISISGEGSEVIQILDPAFREYIPWLTAAWVFEVLLKLYVLVQRRWTRTTRGVELLVDGLSIYALYRVVSGGSITLIPAATTITQLVVFIVMMVAIVGLVVKAYKWCFKRPFATTPNTLINSTSV